MPDIDPAVQFQELLTGIGDLSPLERLISAFLSIRDIPYGSANSPTPFDVLSRNRGTAKGKHLLLKMVLNSLGYEVREYWAKHDMTKMPLEPWPHVLDEFRDRPILGFHDFLKVKMGDRFVTVDATYDKGLRKLGFPVADWDGEYDMPLPVSVIDEIPVEQPIDDQKRALVASLPKEMQERRKKFLKAMKKWLEEERTKL